MAALRLARAYTGKDDYVILEGSYHGLFDAAMWYTPMDKWSPGWRNRKSIRTARGCPSARATSRTLSRPTTPTSSRRCSSAHAGSIACLLIEPIMGNCLGIAADPSYMRAARELCDRYGVVLIIDEVKSGFRVARGGVQELYGVQADLCTFAKARRQRLSDLGAGRARGHHAQDRAQASRTAAPTPRIRCRWQRPKRRCEILDETDALERIAAYGTRLRAGMSAILKARGMAHSFVGHPSMGGLYFAHEPPRTYRDWKGSDYTFYDAAARVLHDERILCEPDSREPWFFLRRTMTRACSDTLTGFEVAVDTTLETLGKSRRMPA